MLILDQIVTKKIKFEAAIQRQFNGEERVELSCKREEPRLLERFTISRGKTAVKSVTFKWQLKLLLHIN